MADFKLTMQHQPAQKTPENSIISSYEPIRAGSLEEAGAFPPGLPDWPSPLLTWGRLFASNDVSEVAALHLSSRLMVPRQRWIQQGGSKSKCSDISIFTPSGAEVE